MPDLIHLAIPATLIALAIGWSIKIERSMKSDRVLVEAHKKRRDHVCGRD